MMFASREDAGQRLGQYLKEQGTHADLVLGLPRGGVIVAAQVAQRFPLQVVAITLRDNPLVWRNSWTGIAYRKGSIFRTRTYEVEIVDRLGAGDSFAAGLIHGLLDGDVQKGLDYGVAASALKHSIPGDFDWVTREEVEALLKAPGLRISR